MAKIELPTRLKVAEAVDRAIETHFKEQPRPHLGASIIGQECSRRIWYAFRWADNPPVEARVRRIYQRGHREEPALIQWLRLAGVELIDKDSSTGEQFRISAHGGHFGGSLDGVAHGIHDAPKTWHVAEFKTHNDASYQRLVKSGVKKSKPEHYSQVIVYMDETDLTRTIYGGVNKNDDNIHWERINADPTEAKRLKEKALRIITADSPPARITDNPSWYACKFCPYHKVCWEERAPEVNCRTCRHSTPVIESGRVDSKDGGVWRCEHWEQQIQVEHQRKGCEKHQYIPTFFERAGTPVDLDEHGAVVYETAEGNWANGDGPGAIRSTEMRALNDGALGLLPSICAVKRDTPSASVVGEKKHESEPSS